MPRQRFGGGGIARALSRLKEGQPAAAESRGPSREQARSYKTVEAAEPSIAPPASRHLWLAVHLPALPLECLPASTSTAPRVVVAGEGTQREVVAVDAAAAAKGIRAGHGLNAAYALCPTLEVVARDAAREAALLQQLARLATQYTPWVSVEGPDGLLLEVRGSLRLFGGTRALLQRWRQDLAARGLTAALALTPTPVASLWCARASVPGAPVRAVASPALLTGALASLPLAVTRWPEAVCERLVDAGARQLGEVLRLPRDGLARRYGPEVSLDLDRALGRLPTPRARTAQPERFLDGLELDAETEDTARLQPAVEALLAGLEAFLRTRNAGVQGVVLQLRHRPGRQGTGPGEAMVTVPPMTRVVLGLAAPCAAARTLAGLLQERLARLVLPAPVLGLRLRSGVAVPLAPQAAQLPGTALEAVAMSDGTPEALLDRLRARLGEDAVQGVCLVPEHRPEAAWCRAKPKSKSNPKSNKPKAKTRAAAKAATIATPPTSLSEAPPRPLWLLPAPQRLRVVQGQPQHEGPLSLERGPERIESGWWDGADVARDYYVVRRPDGVRLWVYRERGAQEAGSWWLHGVFG